MLLCRKRDRHHEMIHTPINLVLRFKENFQRNSPVASKRSLVARKHLTLYALEHAATTSTGK